MTNAEAAYERIVAKRRYRNHVAVFAVFGGLFTILWAQGERGLFWQAFLLAGWGLLLVVCGLALYTRPVTHEQIAAEMERVHVFGGGAE